MPGPPSLMTYPSPNKATKYLCVRLTRPACSRWHVSAWFDRATTGVPRDGPNHSGAAEPTSSSHLTGGFALKRSADPPSSDQWSAPTLKYCNQAHQPRVMASAPPRALPLVAKSQMALHILRLVKNHLHQEGRGHRETDHWYPLRHCRERPHG